MKSVAAIYISPVKSLGLDQFQEVYVASRGIVEDRRLYLIDQQNRLLTQRQAGRLVQARAEYRADPEWLRLQFPDGTMREGSLETGEVVITQIWGRSVPGRLATGDWNQALSNFCQQSVRLVKSDQPGQCYDEYPISLVSQASVQGLNQRVPPPVVMDSRRFRPNFLLTGCQPHEEDDWLGGVVQIGEELVLSPICPYAEVRRGGGHTGSKAELPLAQTLHRHPHPGRWGGRCLCQGLVGHKNIPNTMIYAHLSTGAREARPSKLFASHLVV